jgi:hypothetical protein
MFLYIAYHHNWSGMPDFRRHWLLFLTADRGSNLGIAYDVVDPDENNNWIHRKRENYDVSASGTYQDKVVLGLVEDDKFESFETVITETALPTATEDCQDYVKSVVQKLAEDAIVPKRALTLMVMAPST